MKTSKDVDSTVYTPVYGRVAREGLYPDPGNWLQRGSNGDVRKLIRSVGVWKAGDGRKPEQPYVNTKHTYRQINGTVRCRAPELYNPKGALYIFTGAINSSLPSNGFYPGMSPSGMGGSVKSFPDWPSVGVNPDMLSQAEVKAYKKLDTFSLEKGDASVDFAVAAGERRETGRLLAGAAQGVLTLAKTVAAGFDNPRDVDSITNVLSQVFGAKPTAKSKRQLKRMIAERRARLKRSGFNQVLKGVLISSLVADVWLMHRLAVTPLLSELEGSLNILHQKVGLRDNWVYKVTARHYVNRSSVATKPIDTFNSGVQSFSCMELHGYTVTLVAAPLQGDIDRMAQLGLDNPLATLWELATLTFVVDYFVSVGDYLEALNVPKRFEFIDGSWCQRIVRLYGNLLVGDGTKASGVCSTDHTKRVVYQTFPVPIPPLSLSGKDITLNRFLTMAALAVAKTRKLLDLF